MGNFKILVVEDEAIIAIEQITNKPKYAQHNYLRVIAHVK